MSSITRITEGLKVESLLMGTEKWENVDKVQVCLEFIPEIPKLEGKLSVWRYRNGLTL